MSDATPNRAGQQGRRPSSVAFLLLLPCLALCLVLACKAGPTLTPPSRQSTPQATMPVATTVPTLAAALVHATATPPGAASPTPSPTSTPPAPTATPSPTPTPAPPPASVLERGRIISYYGHPFSPVMGILGEGSMEWVYERLQQQAQPFQALDPEREVKLAFHLIYAVAQSSPGPDGLHLYHTDPAVVQRYVDFTRDNGMLLFLDLQNGYADPVAEVQRVLPYLMEPHIHLAIDPEFTWAPHQRPHVNIGSIDGAQINAVQAMLAELVEQHNLPPKVLIVHQFRHDMVTNKSLVAAFPGVDIVFCMDGFGGAEVKLLHYQLYSVDAPATYRSIKLFYQWDVGLLSPEALLGIEPPPDIIIYQ